MRLQDLKTPSTLEEFLDDNPHNREHRNRMRKRSYLANDSDILNYFQVLFESMKEIMLRSSRVSDTWSYLLKLEVANPGYIDIIEDSISFTGHNYISFKHLLQPDILYTLDPVFDCLIYCQQEDNFRKGKENNLKNTSPKLAVNQIALIHVFNSVQITRDNMDRIAADNKYFSKRSGEGLYQDYTYYSSSSNRKAKPNPYSKTKMKNKIDLFESVLGFLNKDGHSRAIDEINILRTKLDSDED